MDLQTKTYIALVIFGLATINFVTMFELLARKNSKWNYKVVSTIHRISGAIALILMLIVGYYCVVGYSSSPVETSPRGIIHAVAAIAAFFIITVKIGVLRRYGKLSDKLLTYGQILYFCILVTVSLSAGYYLLTTWTKNTDAVAGMLGNKDSFYGRVDTPETGESIMKVKCARCHTLERIYTSRKSSDGWATTIARMTGRAPEGWIGGLEALRIAGFLAHSQGPGKVTRDGVVTMTKVALGVSGDSGQGRQIFEKKCTFCHHANSKETKVGPGFLGLFRRGQLPFSGRDANEATIRAQLNKPIGTMPAFRDLSDQEIKNIVAYLSTL